MIKKIIFVSYEPLTTTFKENFYVDELIKNKFEVEYWDISNIYFPNLFKETIKDSIVFQFYDFKQFEQRILNQENASVAYVVHITYRGLVVKLFRIFAKHNCYLIYFARSMFPSDIIEKKSTAYFVKRIKKIPLIFDYKELLRYLEDKKAYIYKLIKFVKPYDLIFNSGKYGVIAVGRGWNIEVKRSKIIQINNFDYDNFLLLNNNKKTIYLKENYCVFLDQYYPFHPDYSICQTEHIKEENYYTLLNAFFGRLEIAKKLKVIIAAHPKAEKYKSQNYFQGREVYFNRSQELVSDSKFVITHNSSAINFAILFFKPIVFITSEEIKKSMPGEHSSIEHLAKIFRSNLVYYDSEEDFNKITTDIEQQLYVKYKYDYLTSIGIEDKQSKVIVCESLLKNN